MEIKELVEALRPFANAYDRIRHYDEDGMSDDLPLYVDRTDEGIFFDELMAFDPDVQDSTGMCMRLSLGHLANAAQFVRAFDDE